MKDYVKKPVPVRAEQWDGTTSEMYRIVGEIFAHGGRAHIEDGYQSQGPDLIKLETSAGEETVYPQDYIVLDRGSFRKMPKVNFEEEYEIMEIKE